MHICLNPKEDHELNSYNFEEMCPECGTYIPIVIDEQERTCYQVTCPVCGYKMMLCTLCYWDQQDEGHTPCVCDWSPVNGCFRQKKGEQKTDTSTEIVTYDTYPDMMSDYDNCIENDLYDDTMRFFSVSKQWAIDWIKTNFDMTMDEFNKEFTWDDTYEMYTDASHHKVIISESITAR